MFLQHVSLNVSKEVTCSGPSCHLSPVLSRVQCCACERRCVSHMNVEEIINDLRLVAMQEYDKTTWLPCARNVMLYNKWSGKHILGLQVLNNEHPCMCKIEILTWIRLVICRRPYSIVQEFSFEPCSFVKIRTTTNFAIQVYMEDESQSASV